MIYGENYREMTRTILEAVKLDEMIGRKNQRIGLKPNLLDATSPDKGATTHIEIVEGTVQYLKEHGFHDISVTESSWVGAYTQKAFRALGYQRLAKQYDINLVDNQKDSYSSYDARGLRLNICDFPMSVDFMINLPVLKGHCQTKITCALKNNKGLIPNSEKRRFHKMGLHKPIAHLAAVVPNDFILVDNICGDLDFEEGGNPVVMNRILAFKDPVLCDAYVCETIGYRAEEVDYICMAEKLGVGCADTSKARITELNEGCRMEKRLRMTRKIERLARYVDAKDACSACYGSLIYALDRLQEQGILHMQEKEIAIGQGYRGKTGGIGIGNCTCGFQKSCAGCPPKAVDMVEFLKEQSF